MQSQSDVEELILTESLPNADWNQYYDRIYIDHEIKEKLVNYGLLLEQFEKNGFDEMTLAYHGAVLLYGPPGTGKTTLARGVANKVSHSIDGPVKFREVRVEQLFSGTLGDTPKAVSNVFDTLTESAQTGTKQVVLFDEVESLISNRDTLVGETDPMDVARAVNVALERIDELAEYPNIYLISTSNLPSAVDSAFFDRADVHFRIGNPSAEHRAQIINDIFTHLNNTFRCSLPTDFHSTSKLVELTEGFSGRRIRKTVLESIVGDRSTIGDPSQFTVQQVEHTAAATRNRLLRDDGDNLTETQLYQSEDVAESDTDHHTPENTPESNPQDQQKDDEVQEDPPRPDLPPETSDGSSEGDETSTERTIERELPIDESVSGKTGRALDRAGTFLTNLLGAAGYEHSDIIQTILEDDNVESTLYPILMSQSLAGIRVEMSDLSIQLTADYGMGNDDPIPQPLDDVLDTIPTDGPITLVFVVESEQTNIGKLESLEVSTDHVDIAVESVQVSGGDQ